MCNFGVCGDTRIDRDDERHAFGVQLIDARFLHAVAFLQSVRQIHDRFDAVNEIVSAPLRACAKPGEYAHYDAMQRPAELRSELAAAGLEAGWYVSFSGIVTFRSWTDLDLLREIPEDRLLVESDAPYLAPVPNRSKRNEPAFVSHTLARIAAVRGTTPDRLGDITLANTVRLFALPSSVFDIN